VVAAGWAGWGFDVCDAVLSTAAGGSSAALMRVLFWFALVPLGAELVAWLVVVETRGRTLPA
jgi:hypothetical protein